jgi:hypothetical protein
MQMPGPEPEPAERCMATLSPLVGLARFAPALDEYVCAFEAEANKESPTFFFVGLFCLSLTQQACKQQARTTSAACCSR